MKNIILIELPHRNQIPIKGSIIDLETTHFQVPKGKIVTCGILDSDKINILQRTLSDHSSFKKESLELIKKFKRPFYAFNKKFEEDFLGIKIDEELQKVKMEPAFLALKEEGLIEYYNRLADPLHNDEIVKFWKAWKLTKDPIFVIKISQHNYCCLVKELFIKLKRFYNLNIENMPYFSPSSSLKHIWRKEFGFERE